MPDRDVTHSMAISNIDLLNEQRRPIIVATFMRSGTHLTMDLIRKQFAIGGYKYPGEPLDALYLPLDTLLAKGENPKKNIFNKIGRFQRPLCKTHCTAHVLRNYTDPIPEFRDWLWNEGTWIYVLRDPAKVMASLFQFTKEFREIPDLDEWLVRRTDHWVNHVTSWSSDSVNVQMLKFEDILKETRVVLERLQSTLQLECRYSEPLLPKRLRSKWRGRILRLCAITSESTEILTEFKPVPLEEFLSKYAIERFNQVTEELRERFGYPGIGQR